jgi:hypothetical protein
MTFSPSAIAQRREGHGSTPPRPATPRRRTNLETAKRPPKGGAQAVSSPVVSQDTREGCRVLRSRRDHSASFHGICRPRAPVVCRDPRSASMSRTSASRRGYSRSLEGSPPTRSRVGGSRLIGSPNLLHPELIPIAVRARALSM